MCSLNARSNALFTIKAAFSNVMADLDPPSIPVADRLKRLGRSEPTIESTFVSVELPPSLKGRGVEKSCRGSPISGRISVRGQSFKRLF